MRFLTKSFLYGWGGDLKLETYFEEKYNRRRNAEEDRLDSACRFHTQEDEAGTAILFAPIYSYIYCMIGWDKRRMRMQTITTLPAPQPEVKQKSKRKPFIAIALTVFVAIAIGLTIAWLTA